jgi:hypothetical protein
MRLYILFHHVYHVYVSTFFALFHHTFVCLCIQGTDAISPWCMFMYPCFRSISPYFRMFMYPRYWHYFTILICYVSMLSLYFTIFSYVYVSKVLTLFHHIFFCMFMFPRFRSISPYFRMFMYPRYWRYFTILICYVSMLSLYFTIFSYVYVSKVLALFHHI